MSFIGTLQHAASRSAGFLANCEYFGISHALIWAATKGLAIDLSEAEKTHFSSLNDLFTRKLKPQARPIAPEPAVLSPVDGTLSALGKVENQQHITIKAHDYTLNALFGEHHALSAPFTQGDFALYYLAPHDYHRIHAPLSGGLTHMLSVPGQLFSVNETLAPKDVFSRNERVIALFDVPGGKMAVIFVGALLVGSIHTEWAGAVCPNPNTPKVYRDDYAAGEHLYQRGDALGHFQFGSSVLVLFSEDLVSWSAQNLIDKPVKMGESHGKLLGKSS